MLKLIIGYFLSFVLLFVYSLIVNIAVNISSPNTKDLRKLDGEKYFSELIGAIKKKQEVFSKDLGYKPVVLKLSPDLQEKDLENICKQIIDKGIDGIVCSNTTIDHNYPYEGGLSGKELFEISNKNLVAFRKFLGTSFPIIASGGVMSRDHF